MSGLELTPPLFALLSELVESSSGLHYGPNDRDLFGAKLAAHAAELGFDSLLDFYYRLRYDDPDGGELQRLNEALLVHETYFFRELAPLEQLVEVYLRPTIAARGRARVWSAACSTGEEPLTLAMLLDARGLLDRVEIVASDLSSTVIARAKSGRHIKRSLRGEPPESVRKHLDQAANGVTVSPRIQRAVTFRTLNLLDDVAVMALGAFDAIVCRNVLIYFDDHQVVRVVDRLTRALDPNGVVVVGVSESLLRFGTAMVCEERGNSFFYRKAR
ncbi:MAG: CheR family methyltransferase [Kofleriaceae bacterium]